MTRHEPLKTHRRDPLTVASRRDWLIAGLLLAAACSWRWRTLASGSRAGRKPSPTASSSKQLERGEIRSVRVGPTVIAGELMAVEPRTADRSASAPRGSAWSTTRTSLRLLDEHVPDGDYEAETGPVARCRRSCSPVAARAGPAGVVSGSSRAPAGMGSAMAFAKSRPQVYRQGRAPGHLRRRRRASTRSSPSCARSSSSSRRPRSTARSAAGFPRGSCWSARRARARRCWPRPSRARRACRSSRSPAPTSSRCSSASAPRGSATCSRRPRPRPPA